MYPRTVAVFTLALALSGGVRTTRAQGAGEATASFRGNAAHTGVYPGPGPQLQKLVWSFQTGGPVVSSPTLAGGTLYIGSGDNNLYALNPATGKLRWKFLTGGNVDSSPAVAGGTVYVLSLDGCLYAVDARTGAGRWSFATAGERRFTAAAMEYSTPATQVAPDPWDLYLSSPAVAGGMVYFGSGDGNVYAVGAASGKLVWKFHTGEVVHASPAVAGGTVYIGSWDRTFYALDARTGHVRWRFQTGDDPQHLMMGIPGSAAVAGGRVYFGCRDGYLYALNASDGHLLWRFDAQHSWVESSPAVRDGRIYFTTSDTHRFVALDATSGAVLFSLPAQVYAFSSPALAGDRAYFGTFDGRLHEVELERQAYTAAAAFAVPGHGENRARWLQADGRLRQKAVWAGDTVEDVIADMYGKLFSLGSILSSPAVAGGRVYFGSVDGAIYALGGAS